MKPEITKRSVLLPVCAAVLGFGSPAAHADHQQPESIVMFAAAQHGTGIHHNSANLAELYTRRINQRRGTQSHGHTLGMALSSSGSASSIRSLIESRFDFAVVRADVAEAVLQNPARFKLDLRVDHLRVVGTMRPALVHVLARRHGNGAVQLSDLAGRRIGLGLPDQQTRLSVETLFASQGLALDSAELVYAPLEDSLRRLRGGQLDALIAIDQLPAPGIESALRDSNIELVSLDAHSVSEYLDRSADTGRCRLEEVNYAGSADTTAMLSIETLLLARDTVPPAQIEPLAAFLREQHNAASPAVAGEQSPAANSGFSIPYHDAVLHPAWRSEQSSLDPLER